MDDFTQNLLERAKLRRQKLNAQLSQVGTPARVSKPLQEINSALLNKDNDLEKVVSNALITPSGKSKLQRLGELYSENSNVLSSPIHRAEDKILEGTPKPTTKNKCKLGRLNELASNINQWEDDLSHPDLRKKVDDPKNRTITISKKREVEETTTTITSVDQVKTTPAPKKTVHATISMTTVDKSTGKEKNKQTTATIIAGSGGDSKTRKIDQDGGGQKKVPRLAGAQCTSDVIATGEIDSETQSNLETVKVLAGQGFSKKESKKPVYNFGESPKQQEIQNNEKLSAVKSPPVQSEKRSFGGSPRRSQLITPKTTPQKSQTKTVKFPVTKGYSSPAKSPKMGVSALEKESSVLKRAAMFEAKHDSPQKTKDPAELTLAERKALFEKNKGEILLPKVAFATPLPAKLMQTSPVKNIKTNVKEVRSIQMEPVRKTQVDCIRNKLESDLVATTNVNLSKLEREKDLEYLRNRWNKNKSLSGYSEGATGPPPPPPPMPEEVYFSPPSKSATNSPAPVVEYKDSPETLKAVKDVKKIVISPPSGGSLYPSLSDIEVADDEDQSSSMSSLNDSKRSDMYLNLSFGEMLEVSKNNPLTPPRQSRENSVLNALNEALADVSSSDDDATPPKQPCVSRSFEYSHGSPRVAEQPLTPLIHTVSFYRKQQNNLVSATNTPHKIIKRNEIVSSTEDEDDIDETIPVQRKINELQMEIGKQQTVISQASNLLSVCLANIEFSGSEEQVEGERLLLLAAHKRQACLNEIHRLKVEGTIRPRGPNVEQLQEQGDLIISGVTIPLKRDTLRTMNADESMQYFVCLVKSDERVVATPVVAASGHNLDGCVLRVPGEIRLEKLYGDFKATVEVYNLVLSKELLPHHIKYHLPGKKAEKKLLTPIKSKKSQGRLVMPNIQSPAGPNAVRTTNFQMCGYVVFSLRELRRSQWTLNKVPYASPVEGSISMKIQSDLQLDDEHRGFLSMFDDVSGLGAWHRRWCLLSGNTLSYWKYPDDESKKVPLGSIDLRAVITETVGLVSRDVCARLHTFLLETTRPRSSSDTESLVLLLEGDVARVRHLLSADTKEERVDWCARLNKALALLRAWSCQQ